MSIRDTRLWERFNQLTPEKGRQTLSTIVDEETNSVLAEMVRLRKWLLRAEKAFLEMDHQDQVQTKLVLGYMAGCVKGALNGNECPVDDQPDERTHDQSQG